MRTLRSRWALLGLTLTLAACESKADIDSTIPADGQQGVGARTVIAVRLSNTMSEADAGNTDSRNIAVQGDQTEGVYSGSIEPASFSDLFNGQTVEQFRQGEREPGAAGEEEPPADTTEGGEDALVFLLDEGTNFKAGELISVFVSPDVTVRGFPMEEGLNFSFVVEGGDAAADTDLFVVSTDPSKDSLAVDLRPRITADFSLSVRGDSLEGGIAVRGQQSGFHAGGSALFDASRPLTDQATRVLDPLDSLRPGENVTVTWNGDISAGDDTSLSPFLLNFQVKPGEVLSAPDGRSGWQQIDLASTPSSVRVLLAGDFVRPLLEGDDLAEALEFVAVEPGSLELFVRNSSGTYSRRETVIEVPGRLVGAVTMDLNDDGLLEVVVVLEREGGLIVTYEIGDDGFLGRESDPVEFPAVNIDSVLAHDLNADGVPELLVTHGDTTFVPEPVDLLPDFDVPVEPAAPAEPKDTGHITFFERVEGLPPGGIDLNNPQTITTFLRVGRPIFGFTESRRVEAHDLDGDGRLDLVAETAEGIALYRNQSSPSQENPFAFRRVGLLSGPGGAPLQPVHWLVLDVDRDHDLDILSWDAEGLLFHENEQPPRRVPVSSPSSPRSSTPAAPRGILFENLPPVRFPSTLQLARGDLAAVSNVDGDPAGTPDVVVRREAGAVEIFLGSPDTIPPFVNAPLGFPGAGAGAAVALADINGDTGLDVLVASSLDIRALLTDPDLVVPVLLPVPSRFELVPRSLPDGGLEVSVMGDLETKFAGYALAVDYDASVVEYLGFVIPSSFERTASFDLCPDEALAGCAGIATATMAYRQGTVGVVSSGVPLGTFRFRPRPVEEITETIIELTDVESGERSFSNIVTASDAGLTHEVPVTELGEPVRLILNPPPPDPGAALDTECDVLQRLAKGYRARIRWDSPRRVPFDRVLIDVNGEPVPENPIPWGERSYELLDDRGGEVLITVTALTSGQSAVDPPESAPRESCQIISVFQPEVTCELRETSNVVRWTLEEHSVDSFRVYRNGVRVAIIPGSSDSLFFEDRFPSLDGADFYQVAGVLSGVEGPRDGCRGQDRAPCSTEPPVVLAAGFDRRLEPAAPNVLRFRWRNGEAYDGLIGQLRFRPDGGTPADEEDLFRGDLELAGTETEFVYDGDVDRGGALPGTYTFSLEGRVFVPPGESCANAIDGEVRSTLVVFETVVVPVPSLEDIGLTCTPEGLADIRVSWEPVWRGYSGLRLVLHHEVEGEPTVDEPLSGILLSDTEVLVSELLSQQGLPPLEPFGRYQASLVGVFGGSQPDPTASCGIISFEPNIGVGADGRPIEAGIGLASFEIPIVATGIFENITGFEFQLDYPRFVTIDGVTEMDGAAADRKSALIRDLDVEIDPDPDGDRRVSGTVVLARLTGRIEVDFALRERSPETLVLSGTKLRFAGGKFRDVGPPSSGQLLLSDRYVVLDRVETDVGSTEPVTVAVRLTFQAPDGAPDYKFNAFQVHIEFDPEELTLLPVTLEDQVGTAIEGEGFLVLPGQNSLARANEMGDFLVAWLGFDFSNPTVPTFLEPVVDERLVVLKFRSRLPATSPEVFSSISFITDRSRGQPTAFFPVEDVPGVPDLRSFFPGGVLQRSSVPDLNVAAVVPARGALTGGNRVSLLGSGFPTAPDAGLTIQLRSPIGELLHVDPATVERLGSGELSFEVPDSGLRASSFVGSIPFDIQVHAQFPEGLAEGFLRRGYRYEAPVLVSADVGSVHAMASDLVSLTGRGLAHDARVEFRVDGFATPFPADIFRRDDDGSGIVIVASGLPGPAAGEPFRLADLSVVQSEAPDSTAETVLTLGERIRILPATGDVGLRISDVLPGSASHCGGETLTILGDGFTDSTEVRFGDVPAVSVQRRSSRELLAVVPFFDSPRVVALRLLDAGLLAESPYELTEPPDFRRGDVDGDGRINMTDATRLANMVLGSAEPPDGQPNRDAWDVDDNGEVDFADAIWLLRFLFEGGPPPLDPFVAAGQDPSNLADGICQ